MLKYLKLLALQSQGEIEGGLQVCEPLAAVTLCCFLLQMRPSWAHNSTQGDGVILHFPHVISFCLSPPLPPALPVALLLSRAGESGWLTEPSGRGCSWMAQAHMQQPPLMPYLVLQETWELE